MTRPSATPDPRTAEGLEAIRLLTLSAAREASLLVYAGYRTDIAVEHKGPVDLVTEFDRDSEALLRARLGAALPFPIIGEETPAVPIDDPETPTFFVDPVDGTTNFVHGHPFWCVSIGLAIGSEPVLGVVVAPALGLEWSGWSEPAEPSSRLALRRTVGNAMVTPSLDVTAPSAVSTTARFEDALLATGFPYDRRTSDDNNFDAFVAIKRRCRAVRRCGSAALDLCLVADGTYAGYWERKLRPWDIVGGCALVRAAGGTLTDFEGGSSFLATGHLVATNGAIHAELLAELARVSPPSRRP